MNIEYNHCVMLMDFCVPLFFRLLFFLLPFDSAMGERMAYLFESVCVCVSVFECVAAKMCWL